MTVASLLLVLLCLVPFVLFCWFLQMVREMRDALLRISPRPAVERHPMSPLR